MLMEAMGLHVPGAAFVNPQHAAARRADARAARTRAGRSPRSATTTRRSAGIVDERSIVNAMVGAAATGGSTNHLIHLVAMARAAGIVIDWNDFDELSGRAAAGARLSERQRRREPVPGRRRHGLRDPRAARRRPAARGRADRAAGGLRDYTRARLDGATAAGWRERAAAESAATTVVRRRASRSAPTGGLKLLTGNLGRA
jgi:phosphogluconate dehydratase